MALEAYPNGDYFRLEGKTYQIREKIKRLEGKWNGTHWLVKEESLGELQATKMQKVKHEAHCHEEAGECWASEKDIENGYVVLGCGMCDTPARCGSKVKIN